MADEGLVEHLEMLQKKQKVVRAFLAVQFTLGVSVSCTSVIASELNWMYLHFTDVICSLQKVSIVCLKKLF